VALSDSLEKRELMDEEWPHKDLGKETWLSKLFLILLSVVTGLVKVFQKLALDCEEVF